MIVRLCILDHVGRENSNCRERARGLRHDDIGYTQRPGQINCVEPAGAAKGKQGKLATVVAHAQLRCVERAFHVCVCDCQ